VADNTCRTSPSEVRAEAAIGASVFFSAAGSPSARYWPDGDPETLLTIEVRNATNPDRARSRAGQGLVGMRQRLESVGGRLAVSPGADVFAVTASLPAARP
jgi:hypothetical protein